MNLAAFVMSGFSFSFSLSFSGNRSPTPPARLPPRESPLGDAAWARETNSSGSGEGDKGRGPRAGDAMKDSSRADIRPPPLACPRDAADSVHTSFRGLPAWVFLLVHCTCQHESTMASTPVPLLTDASRDSGTWHMVLASRQAAREVVQGRLRMKNKTCDTDSAPPQPLAHPCPPLALRLLRSLPRARRHH
jgi:hypothetical protein